MLFQKNIMLINELWNQRFSVNSHLPVIPKSSGNTNKLALPTWDKHSQTHYCFVSWATL